MPEIIVQTPQSFPEQPRRKQARASGDLTGRRFGRWQVLDNWETTPKGEKKWLCRCTCGTERYVLERSLRHGGSLSCGCLRREALSEAVSHDIAGQTFGDLTAISRSDSYHKNGGIWWNCLCACGSTCEVPATLLVTGRKTHCGCKTQKEYYHSDIAGQRFGRLTALCKTDKRDSTGGVIWRCRCDCGNEVDVPYNNMMYANQQSCGCQKKEHDQLLSTYLTHVGGTSLDILKSSKVPTDNTTGHKGVYLIKGKYVAKIVFQKKAYYLGSYTSIEEAYQARLEAEEALFRPTILYYTKWQERAKLDPEWAKENPVKITVEKSEGILCVTFLPSLDEEQE